MAASANKKKKKKRSQAPVALVYFITLLIFLGVFGVIAYQIIDRLTNTEEETVDYSDTYIDSYNTLYARVNNSGVLSDLSVIRVCPEQGKIIVIPLSALTITGDGTTFREVYEEGGIRQLQTAVDETLVISTDYYMTVSNQAFEDIADIIGGFVYTPDEELYKLADEDENDISLRANESVTLTGRQIRLICQTSVFSEGRQGNVEFLGLALTNLINNAFDQVDLTTSCLDVFYNKLVAGGATNLTENDFSELKVYLKSMINNQEEPAVSMIPEGTWNEDNDRFEISTEFKQEVYDEMEATKSEAKSESAAAE